MLHGLIKSVQERVKVTFQVAAGLAESLGAPPLATSVLQRLGGLDQEEDYYQGSVSPREAYPPPPVVPAAEPELAEPEPEPAEPELEPEPEPEVAELEPEPVADEEPAPAPDVAQPAAAAPRPKTAKRREMVGDKTRSEHVSPLKVEDAINGSTYLARIIWSLGIAELEGIGPLRPADMARMIMARSPVSLEPPNVARYIRRSKPVSITVDHKEGSSSFYRLSDAGHELFQEKFVK